MQLISTCENALFRLNGTKRLITFCSLYFRLNMQLVQTLRFTCIRDQIFEEISREKLQHSIETLKVVILALGILKNVIIS